MSPVLTGNTIDSPSIVAVLAADAGEQVGHAVIVVERPAFERMVVALGAADRQAQKSQRRGLVQELGILVQHEIVRGPVVDRAARGGDDSRVRIRPRACSSPPPRRTQFEKAQTAGPFNFLVLTSSRSDHL